LEQVGQSNEIKDCQGPQYTYGQMIIQAIITSPERRLKLYDIYKYINTNYPFYQMNQKGWKGSVRHNLSIQDYFLKLPSTIKSAGKGCFWYLKSDKKYEETISKCFKKKLGGAKCSNPSSFQQNVSTNAAGVELFTTTSTKETLFNIGITEQNVVPIANIAKSVLKQHDEHNQQSSSNGGFQWFHSVSNGGQTAHKVVAAQSSMQHQQPTHLSIADLAKNNTSSSLPCSSVTTTAVPITTANSHVYIPPSQQSHHQPTGSFKVDVSNINNATTSANAVSSQQQVNPALSVQHPQQADDMLSHASRACVINNTSQPIVQIQHSQPTPIHRVPVPVFHRPELPVAHHLTRQVVHWMEKPFPKIFLLQKQSTISHQPAGLLPIIDLVSNSARTLNEQTTAATTAAPAAPAATTAVLPVVVEQREGLDLLATLAAMRRQ